MKLPINVIRLAQQHLGFSGSSVDGIPGSKIEEQLDQVLAARKGDIAPQHADTILSGSRKRKLITYLQLLAVDRNIEAGVVDGYWGPQTNFAVDSLAHLQEHGALPENWRDIEPSGENPNNWPQEGTSAFLEFYGQPGDESNLVRREVPYPLRLSWDLQSRVKRVQCHHKVADSLLRVMQQVREHYGLAQIKSLRLDVYGGSFVARKQRGGSKWSTHAWGIALDFDPDRNKLKWGRDRAVFARPEYDAWWSFWEKEGWLSLGRAENYDWMHIQAAKR